MSRLTEAERRALQAVADGKVTRVYTQEGNTMHSAAGNGARTLWALARKELITDGPSTGNYYVTCTQVLTKEGRAALK